MKKWKNQEKTDHEIEIVKKIEEKDQAEKVEVEAIQIENKEEVKVHQKEEIETDQSLLRKEEVQVEKESLAKNLKEIKKRI